jgi:hypothetical protein
MIAAGILGSQYLRANGGRGITSGSDELMTLMLLVVAAVLAGSFALLRPGRGNPDGSRLTSIVWSLALLTALVFTWRVIAVADRWQEHIGTPIASPQDLVDFIGNHPASVDRYDYRVPTGAFLQSFEFLSSNNVEMTGYIWQFYGNDIPPDVTRGLVFPEALEQAYDVQEAWRIERDAGVYIGWYFSGEFRQNFDYRLYPFDRQDVWLRLWHPDPERDVLLTPDFASYSNLDPASLPGIEKSFVYGGWDPISAGFSYGLVTYNANFGLQELIELNGTPLINLYFNFSVKRDFLGPLLEHLVLETAIALLVFFLLLLTAKGSDVHQTLGLTVFDLVVASAGLLFAVILDLNSIRGAIASQELTYLEWLPLILIVFIVLVVLNAVLRAQDWRVPVLGYTGDLVPVVAYWPALLGAVLVMTLLVFFF